MTASCDLLDFFRRHAVAGDVANIVNIPIEAGKKFQLALSIYS